MLDHNYYMFILTPPLVSLKVTFEDKKRENFERGNLELEKRRQALQEQQRKEQERLAALEREEQERKVKYKIFFLCCIVYI